MSWSPQRRDNIVADMEVDMVADMVTDMEVDMLADTVAVILSDFHIVSVSEPSQSVLWWPTTTWWPT